MGGKLQDRSAWLVALFVLAGVLVPSACVLWFMNQAAKTQAEAARQSIAEAYRGQLRLLRGRIDSYWAAREAALKEKSGMGTGADFARGVSAGLADSLIYLKPDGSPAYPSSMSVPPPDPALDRADWRAAQALEQRRDSKAAAAYAAIATSAQDPSIAARAAQAQIRCLLRNGDRQSTLKAIREYFLKGRMTKGLDLQGRLIAADEQLLALRLGQPRARQRLIALLNDYQHAGAAIPSAQRLFLIDEAGDTSEFPTYSAERLAQEFLERDGTAPADAGLQRSRVPDVWKLAPAGSRAIALYRTSTILSAMRTVLEQQNPSSDVKFAALQPGAPATAESIPAGPLLPGWQLAFSLVDTKPVEELARQRMVSYLWGGYLAIAAVIVMGLLVGQSFRRQWRLAHLKTDLVAAVSHELKTPLASMRLLVDSLLDDSSLDPVKTRDYLQLIAGENLRLTRLIENFLTFSRIERNRHKFAFAEVEPRDVVQSAVQTMRERFPSAECHLEVDVVSDLPSLYADEDSMVTVLLNLLDNAFKYSPGEKRIVLRAYPEEGRETSRVAFAVQDHGIGIDPREQKRIFRKFYQVDQRLARETGGCGLGLSIVEFIVRAHRGSIRVESRAGVGSTFTVSLPCLPEARGAAA